jgi:hypothetical protein
MNKELKEKMQENLQNYLDENNLQINYTLLR